MQKLNLNNYKQGSKDLPGQFMSWCERTLSIIIIIIIIITIIIITKAIIILIIITFIILIELPKTR